MARKTARKTAKKAAQKTAEKDPNWVEKFLERNPIESDYIPPLPPEGRLGQGEHYFNIGKGLPAGKVVKILREQLGQGYGSHTYNVETGVVVVRIPHVQ